MRPLMRGVLHARYRYWRRLDPVAVKSDGFCTKPLKPFPRECHRLPPWIKFPPIQNNQELQLLDELKADAQAFKKVYNDDSLKKIFEEKIRWFLASRLILVCNKINDPEVSELHFQNKLRGHTLRYVTARTLMKSLAKIREEHWMPVLQALVDQNVIVLTDWDEKNELQPLEVLFLKHGPVLAGDSEVVTFTVQTDACWHEEKDLLENGTVLSTGSANIASIIWNAADIIDLQLTSNISCVSSEYAEALGVLSALKRGKKLPVNIDKVVVITDNKPNADVLNGKVDIYKCKHPEVIMAIFQVAKEYKVCIFQHEEREALFLVNALASKVKMRVAEDLAQSLYFTETLDKSDAAALWGMPMIRINQREQFVTNKMSKKIVTFDENLFSSKSYYVTVPQQDLKLNALEGLLTSLNPSLVILLVGSNESANKVLVQLKVIYPQKSVKISDPADASIDLCNANEYEVFVLVNQNKIPLFPAIKALVVTCDISNEPICYAADQDKSGVVILLSERSALPDAAEEVNPFMYPFFNGKKFNYCQRKKGKKKIMEAGVTDEKMENKEPIIHERTDIKG